MLNIFISATILGLMTISNLTATAPFESKIIQAPFSQPMAEKKYAAIIFDLGGVLVDEKQVGATAEKFFPGTPAALIMKTIYRGKLWNQFDRGDIDLKSFAQLIEQEYGFDASLTISILSQIVTHLPLLAKGIEILKAVKAQGYKAYVLSNAYQGIYESLCLTHPTLFDLFDGEIISCNEHFIKPEPEIYKALLARYNINPAEALFIDDLEVNIIGATTLGIDGIVCKNTNEVLQLLQQHNVLSATTQTSTHPTN